MPLSDVQKNEIVNAIAHLLDFSLDPISLKLEVEQLKEALGITNTPLSETNPYIYLGKALKYPRNYFQKLENASNQPTTLFDVQSFIFDLINEAIIKAAKNTEMTLAILDWEPEVKENLCPNANKDVNFKSGRTSFQVDEEIWTLSPLRGKVYTRTLKIIEKTRYIAANLPNHKKICDYSYEIMSLRSVEIKDEKTNNIREMIPITWQEAHVEIQFPYFPEREPPHSILIRKIELVGSPVREEHMRDEICTELEQYAENLALNSTIDFLLEKEIITQEVKDKLSNEIGRFLLLVASYFQKLINKEIDITFFFALSPQQQENLSNLSVQTLIDADCLSSQEAKDMSAFEKSVVTYHFYFGALQKGEVAWFDLKGCDEANSKTLKHPLVTKLIKERKISALQVKLLPIHLNSLLTTSLYHTYFLTHTVNWEKFGTVSERRANLLRNNEIAALIGAEKLSFDQIINARSRSVTLLINHSALINYLKHNLITLDDLFTFDVVSVHAKVCARRIKAIYDGSPYKIEKDITDTINGLYHHALPVLATEIKEDLAKLNLEFFRALVLLIKNDLCHYRIEIGQLNKRIFSDLMIIIEQCENGSSPEWQQTFNQLVTIANEFVRNSSTAIRFFSSNDNNQHKTTISNMTLFKQSIQENNAMKEDSSFLHKIAELSDLVIQAPERKLGLS